MSGPGGWTPALPGPNIVITESNDFYGTGIDKIDVRIKLSSVGDRLFTQLNVVITA